MACLKIVLMQEARSSQRGLQLRLDLFRQHGDPILKTLPIADKNLMGIEMEILDPQRDTLQQAQATSIKDLSDQGVGGPRER